VGGRACARARAERCVLLLAAGLTAGPAGPDLREAAQRLDEARARERGEERPLSRAVRAWLGAAQTYQAGWHEVVVLSLCWQGSPCVRRRGHAAGDKRGGDWTTPGAGLPSLAASAASRSDDAPLPLPLPSLNASSRPVCVKDAKRLTTACDAA
jgi:hypothetical protein